ncbi:hypothetical protein CTAYLR_000897 [Chrysophaeum taylorii]|uniref:O-methyltransferase n=1 Tax=Chrysophaeum taylorii TaxID=2483200 RepID=A0AAD7XMQ6_9STRA|nr:hypothetical protein CTAYLR_000897 [Chrysophaeum taylorii]
MLRFVRRSHSAVDSYFERMLVREDEALRASRSIGASKGFPQHEVSPLQGSFLKLLAETAGAKRILEIGTLAGYSTIWFARVEGIERVVTLELEPERAAVARENLARASLDHLVDCRVGPALDSLQAMTEEDPFDFVFIDADKQNNPAYLTHALRLAAPGSLILADNVVRDGAVVDDASDDPRVRGVRDMATIVANEPTLDATALQTVGKKGWDGFMLMRVK